MGKTDHRLFSAAPPAYLLVSFSALRSLLRTQRELGKQLDRVSKLAEPVMLLVMGVVVGVLVSSPILPIFKLSRAVT